MSAVPATPRVFFQLPPSRLTVPGFSAQQEKRDGRPELLLSCPDASSSVHFVFRDSASECHTGPPEGNHWCPSVLVSPLTFV